MAAVNCSSVARVSGFFDERRNKDMNELYTFNVGMVFMRQLFQL